MDIIIYRGTKEIGGTLIEVCTTSTRILIDAGYPLFLNNEPIADDVAKKHYSELLALNVLPDIKGLYAWDQKDFDAVIISHAHIDHYGLLKYIHPSIPVYLSPGTETLIRISQAFQICEKFELDFRRFTMYEPFQIREFSVTPYLMDHSAYDAAAFEITAEGKTVLYSGDFRGHGRKAICLNRFIERAKKDANILLTEGSTLGRAEERILTETEIEETVIKRMEGLNVPLLFQCSSQNIDRLVSFYRAALRLKRKMVVDVYTANVLYELRKLGNNLPYPSSDYPNIKVFFPYRLTQKIFNEIGEEYAKQFSDYHISRRQLKEIQDRVVMLCRPSMHKDLEKSNLKNGVFMYSLWTGYRSSDYQQRFEKYLEKSGFSLEVLHTSGHATISDIQRVIQGLNSQKIIPIHTLHPTHFLSLSDRTDVKTDGVKFRV